MDAPSSLPLGDHLVGSGDSYNEITIIRVAKITTNQFEIMVFNREGDYECQLVNG